MAGPIKTTSILARAPRNQPSRRLPWKMKAGLTMTTSGEAPRSQKQPRQASSKTPAITNKATAIKGTTKATTRANHRANTTKVTATLATTTRAMIIRATTKVTTKVMIKATTRVTTKTTIRVTISSSIAKVTNSSSHRNKKRRSGISQISTARRRSRHRLHRPLRRRNRATIKAISRAISRIRATQTSLTNSHHTRASNPTPSRRPISSPRPQRSRTIKAMDRVTASPATRVSLTAGNLRTKVDPHMAEHSKSRRTST